MSNDHIREVHNLYKIYEAFCPPKAAPSALARSEPTGPSGSLRCDGVVGLGSSETEALALSWLAAASERNKLATLCRECGDIDGALPLENSANAYERCARELKQAVACANQRQPQPNS